MKKLEAKQFSALILHNKNIMTKSSGALSKKEVGEYYEASMGDFVQQIHLIREGKILDHYGRPIAANDISLEQALQSFYNVDFSTWLKQMQVFSQTDTLESMARRFGHNNLSAGTASQMMVDHSDFSGLNNTDDINKAFRWIIPEVILAAIRTDYEASSMHLNWIATTQNMTKRDAKMPLILRGNATPRKIGEGESIPLGTIKFGQKSVEVFKVGTGFEITDELVEDSSLNLVFNFLGEVGTDMSLASDVEALNVLVNGDQADGSESAPVVGVETPGTFAYRDLKRVVARMERLKRNATRILSGEDDGLDIALLEEFKGFPGDTKLGNINGIMGKVLSLANDIYITPPDQVMMLAPGKAMAKLLYKGMKIERDRNAQNQTNALYVSDHIGFGILRRDARVLIDKTVTYDATAGETGGFPLYMDIDTRLTTSFKNLQNK